MLAIVALHPAQAILVFAQGHQQTLEEDKVKKFMYLYDKHLALSDA